MQGHRAYGRKNGFSQTGALLSGQIRKAAETRGFAQSRLLTHWAEVVGQDFAERSLPVKVTYARNGLGATLVLLCRGADAPMLQMELSQILSRVNACYGYRAIQKIKLTQTAPHGFEGFVFRDEQRPFTGAPSEPSTVRSFSETAIDPSVIDSVEDENLRRALNDLYKNLSNNSDEETA